MSCRLCQATGHAGDHADGGHGFGGAGPPLVIADQSAVGGQPCQPVEAPLLRALPAERFDTALSLSARVDRYAQIMVRQCQYSVPARLIGARVRVALSASELVVFDGARRVATHPRLIARGQCRLELDHYLEILLGKPGALPGSTALA